MKKISGLFIALAGIASMLGGCAQLELREETAEGRLFHASFESIGTPTKTYLDSDHKLLWTADDRLSIFDGTTYNHQYRYKGATGKTSADFEEVAAGGFHSGNALSTNYAIYPYNEATEISNDGNISLSLPAIQAYAEGSFGLEANTMVAVTNGTNDTFLSFKNLCGYLVFRFYGSGRIKNIIIQGNNGEILAGTATVIAKYGQDPTLTMASYGKRTVTLESNVGFWMGGNAAEATEFWFCLPPTIFSNGFTVTVTNTDGWSMVKTVSGLHTVSRNMINTMAPLNVVFDQRLGNVEFDDDYFKAYCVKNFDTNHDGEISHSEALEITTISTYGSYDENSFDLKRAKSLKGIERFLNLSYFRFSSLGYDASGAIISSPLRDIDLTKNTKLRSVSIDNNLLSTLNVSGLPKLERLECRGYLGNDNGYYGEGTLESINMSGCTSIKSLYLDANPALKSVDLSDLTELTDFVAYWSGLTSVDLSANTKLEYLYLTGNPLSTIDLSKNINLDWVALLSTDIKALDISHNNKLKTLYSPMTNIVGDGASLEFFQVGVNDPTINNYTVPFNNLKTLHFWSPEGETFDFIDLSACTSLEEFLTSWRSVDNFYFGPSASTIKILSIDHLSGNFKIDLAQFKSLEVLDCSGGTFSSLDVSPLTKLKSLNCKDSPGLTEIWLKTGQTIPQFTHDDSLVIRYKD